MRKIILLVTLSLLGLSLALDMQGVQGGLGYIRRTIQDFERTRPQVRYSTATGGAHLVSESKKSLEKRSSFSSVSEGLAVFLSAHPEIGVTDQALELVELSRSKDAQIKTLTMITYQQMYKGLPVDGSLLKVVFNAENRAVSSSGALVPNLELDVVPKISGKDAIALARPSLPQDMTFTLADYSLVVYRTNMAFGTPGTNHLAYHVTFTCSQHFEAHFVYVDAHDGSVLNAYSPTAHALNRRVIDFGVGTVFTEGGAVPTEPQAKLVVDIIEVLYNAMKNVGGWDGWDLNGTEFKNTINMPTNGFPGFRCPNAALYNSASIGALFCPGWAYAIDVIAHEWGHGYSRGIIGSTGLVYQGQSGALDESFADIMGETMQLLLKQPVEYAPRPNRDCTAPGGNQRWIMADNLPEDNQKFPNINNYTIGLRDMYNPSCFKNPTTTADSTYVCNPYFDQGGVHFNSGIPNQVYSLFVDGGEFNSVNYTGVGLLKALHIFMRGLTKHTPNTNFAQHADFVKAACSELVDAGTDLSDPLTGQASGAVVQSADCSVLADLYAAVKMDGPVCVEAPESYLEPEILDGPFPPVIFNVGLDVVYWLTYGFEQRRTVYCRFVGYENFPWEGSFVSNQYAFYASCSIPPIDGTGKIEIQISADNSTWLAPSELTVIAVYDITAYGPTYGPLEGGVTVQFEGSGFVNQFRACNPDYSTENIDCAVCYFGYDATGVPVPATVQSATAASCVAPDWPSMSSSLNTNNKTMEIWLSMNYFLAVGPMDFEYKDGIGPVGAVPLTTTPFGFAPPNAPSATIFAPVNAPQKRVSFAHKDLVLSTVSLVISVVALF